MTKKANNKNNSNPKVNKDSTTSQATSQKESILLDLIKIILGLAAIVGFILLLRFAMEYYFGFEIPFDEKFFIPLGIGAGLGALWEIINYCFK